MDWKQKIRLLTLATPLLSRLKIDKFFVNHGGAGAQIMPDLAALVEKQGQKGGSECDGKKPEQSDGLQSTAHDTGEDWRWPERDRADRADAADALPQRATGEEGFADGKIEPENE